jgi:hypothetical protein
MGLYAKGFNVLLKDLQDMVTGYFHSIPDSGPTLEAKPHLFSSQSFAVSAVKEAREAFTAAKEEAPAALASLGPASDRVIAASDQAIAVFAAAAKYYEAENYKDDQLAKGKQLHAAMLAARKELSAAMGALEDGLSGIEDAQATADIKDHEGDKSYGYWFRFYTFAAKQFLGASRDAGKLEGAYQAIGAAREGLAAFAATKGSELAPGFAPYVASADSFYAACTKLVRQAKGVHAETGDAGQGLIAAYNVLIRSGNFLYELESTSSLK